MRINDPSSETFLKLSGTACSVQEKSKCDEFEQAFARRFNVRYAIAYPYGRSALWALLKALDIQDAEIIQPAYTCVVVAHATLLSGNRPRFVDVSLHDYNMNLDQVEAAINERTRPILATHLFGYPLDIDRLDEIVRRAEARYGHKIWVIQDCAHSFGGEWQGKPVVKAGDAALFGLNISKMITSIFGGMLATDDDTGQPPASMAGCEFHSSFGQQILPACFISDGDLPGLQQYSVWLRLLAAGGDALPQ